MSATNTELNNTITYNGKDTNDAKEPMTQQMLMLIMLLLMLTAAVIKLILMMMFLDVTSDATNSNGAIDANGET